MPRRLALLTMLAAACGRWDPPAGPVLFRAMDCMACHRVGAAGGDAGPDLSFVGLRRSRDWLELWLEDPRNWKHDAEMPFMRISPGSRRILGDWLATLKGQDYPPGRRPWEKGHTAVQRGRLLYDRAGCAACHGPAGRGGHPNNNVKGGSIPALDVLVGTYTREELVNKVSRGVKPLKANPAGPEPMAVMPAWGGVLTRQEMEDAADYLATLAKPGTSDW